MIASGNIRETPEAVHLATLGRDTMNLYFIDAPQPLDIPDNNILESKQRYCENQLQNPHSANVIKNLLELSEDEINAFKRQQFPY